MHIYMNNYKLRRSFYSFAISYILYLVEKSFVDPPVIMERGGGKVALDDKYMDYGGG